MEFTGSSYQGDRVNGRMEGKGEYTFASGTRYVGEMLDGEFHGHGILYFPNGSSFEAQWEHGRAVGPTPSKGECTFKDGLKYDEGDWDYCDEDDRRFYRERVDGVRPAGETLETNDGHAHDIPADTFDTGDGYFDPQTGNVMSYDGETVLRTPAKDETKWITDTCRTGPSSASS